MAQQKTTLGMEHQASAKLLNIPVSTKHSVEIAKAIRYKTTAYAKQFLEDVVALKRAVEFKTFKRNVGHKAGMASGRFPQKAARQFIKLVHSVEANAQFKGLNVDDLKIVKMTANLASIPSGGGRQRHKTKRTHLEIVVKEKTPAQKKNKKNKKEEAVVETTHTPHIQTAHNPVGSHPTSSAAPSPSPVAASTTSPHTVSKPTASTTAKMAAPKAEPTSQDLLKKAQARAAELNQAQANKKTVDEVSNLYSELSKKGTLRDAKATSVKQS